MKRLLFLVFLLASGAGSQGNMLMAPTTAGAPPAGCAQATTFLARTSGENTTALTTLICGLVTDGIIDADASMSSSGTNPYCGTKLERFFEMAMANSTDALLDLCGHATGATAHGSPTFTANAGFTGTQGDVTVYIDSGYDPSTMAVNYLKDSAHVGIWSMETGSHATPVMGSAANGDYAALYLNYSGTTDYTCINDACADPGTADATSGHGLYVANRSGSSASQLYVNGALAASPNQTSTAIPTVLPADTGLPLGIAAIDSTGAFDGSGVQVSVVTVGASLNSTLQAALYDQGCAYLVAVHGSC